MDGSCSDAIPAADLPLGQRSVAAAVAAITPRGPAAPPPFKPGWRGCLEAFAAELAGAPSLRPVSAYGHGDSGPGGLDRVFARVAGVADRGPLRLQFVSGTHGPSPQALYGVLRPGDGCWPSPAAPYDTLEEVIGLRAAARVPSAAEFGIHYDELELDRRRAGGTLLGWPTSPGVPPGWWLHPTPVCGTSWQSVAGYRRDSPLRR